VPHALAPASGADGVSRDDARRRLGIADAPQPVFVCVGFLQPSKGFDRAVEAFARASARERHPASTAAPSGSLYLVGSVRDETGENLAHVETLTRRVAQVRGAHLVERFLSDEEFDLWIAAADRVVLPYRRAWSSGVLAHAHAVGTRAIVAAS